MAVGLASPASSAVHRVEDLLTLGSGLSVVDAAVEDGMVLAVLSPNMSVFAPIGSRVELILGDGSVTSTLWSDETTLPVHEWSDSDAIAMFDALDNGAPAADVLRDSTRSAASDDPLEGQFRGCHDYGDDRTPVQATGCSYVNYGDAYGSDGGRHQADASWASGRSNNSLWYLTSVMTAHKWGANHEHITRYSPEETRAVGACSTETVSVSYGGASIQQSSNMCPEMIDPNPLQDKVFTTEWFGRKINATRYVQEANTSTIPRSGISGFSHSVKADYDYNKCGGGFAPTCWLFPHDG